MSLRADVLSSAIHSALVLVSRTHSLNAGGVRCHTVLYYNGAIASLGIRMTTTISMTSEATGLPFS
jgi:hypothetical protein